MRQTPLPATRPKPRPASPLVPHRSPRPTQGYPVEHQGPPNGRFLRVPRPSPARLYKEMGYDPARWVPIALLATGPYVLVLRKNFEASTLRT